MVEKWKASSWSSRRLLPLGGRGPFPKRSRLTLPNQRRCCPRTHMVTAYLVARTWSWRHLLADLFCGRRPPKQASFKIERGSL